ncbi:helix-turn-helix transcriptional regulator [Microbispora sp. H11081]|uniref:ArsR/SmtB family transcription factor n=1 Tax=Microbispora sp. H11081 TaxID=2729107 RepID=UPI001472FAEE|nr:helix-turn-helix domain-containing protein [Microbispora sp. H11081]
MDQEVFHVRDSRTLKAVAHPLRVRLLGELRANGSATATELAARLGESSGSTSYHLRQLARYGFLEQDPDRRDRRERRWRAIHRFTSWSDVEMAATAEGREAAAFLRRRQLEKLAADVENFERERDLWSEEWVEAAGMSDLVVRLSPATVADLYERVSALFIEAGERDRDDPDARQVSVLLAAHPRRDDPAAGHA